MISKHVSTRRKYQIVMMLQEQIKQINFSCRLFVTYLFLSNVIRLIDKLIDQVRWNKYRD